MEDREENQTKAMDLPHNNGIELQYMTEFSWVKLAKLEWITPTSGIEIGIELSYLEVN